MICGGLYGSIAGFDAWNVFVCIFEGFNKLKDIWIFPGNCYICLMNGSHELGGTGRTRRRSPGPGDPGPTDPGTRARGTGGTRARGPESLVTRGPWPGDPGL